MLELILAIVGGYLIGDSIKESNPEEYAEGGELDDDIAYAKSKAMDNIDWDELLREYASNHYYELTQREKGEIISEMQKDWHRSYQFSEGGEVSKSWGVMLFKESKNRFGERIESAFNNLIMKGTLKQVIEDVKEELVGNVIYGTIKDRAGDVLVAKVKQDGTINIYREGYGFDKMAKGGKVSDVYIFDIYLYSYNDEGSIDGVKEKRKMSVKASSRAKAYDIVKRKYPNPYFVELNRLKSDGNTKNN